MPLNTKIERNGKTYKPPGGWSGFTVVAMMLASVYDSGIGPFEDNSKVHDFSYPDDCAIEEYRGKTHEDYPTVPAPINPGEVFNLMGYHILAMTPLNHGKYTLKNGHKFLDTMDGTVIHFLPDDVLHAWRSS